MIIQRYDVDLNHSEFLGMEPHPKGDWVYYDEYEGLLLKYDRLVPIIEKMGELV